MAVTTIESIKRMVSHIPNVVMNELIDDILNDGDDGDTHKFEISISSLNSKHEGMQMPRAKSRRRISKPEELLGTLSRACLEVEEECETSESASEMDPALVEKTSLDDGNVNLDAINDDDSCSSYSCSSTSSFISEDSMDESSRSGGPRLSLTLPDLLHVQAEKPVDRLRQNRLSSTFSKSGSRSSGGNWSIDLTEVTDASVFENLSASRRHADDRLSPILMVDVSGFTKLSTSMEVEQFSKIINAYFRQVIAEIHAYGGDILKIAGDMLIVEWRPEDASGQHRRQQEALLLASICASNIVAKCSDLPVSSDGIEISTLNVHCGLGFGKVVGLSVGDTERREYLVIGDCVRQVTNAINAASQGEVVASPEALSVLRDLVLFDDSIDLSVSTAQVIAHKGKRKFRGNQRRLSTVLPHQEGYAGIYESWSLHELELLRRKMAPYVHPVVAEREFSVDAGLNVAGNQSMTAELREVFTVFIQPRIQEDLTGKDSSDIRVHELLNNIMLLVKKEISFFKGQLRQCVFDDKGLVIMVNLGLRGSTFPNLIKERGVPFVEKVQMLLKSELNLETAIGASYGKAYCGIVGCEERGEYAILGPAVNLAARLMGHPMNPGVLVDLAVKQKAGGLPFKPLPPVAAKGYDKPVKIFKPLYSDQEESKDTNTQFNGRKSELQHLQASAERVYTGCKRSNFTLISAPCGIGKTLLLRKATKEMEAWCHSQGLSYHISEHIFFHDDSFKPFSVVRPLFLDLLRRKQEASKGMHQVIGHTSSLGLSHEIEEAQLYVTLLQICLQNQVPMPYIEMFGGLLFTDKLSEIGKWSDRSRKKSEWSKAAKYFVKVYVSYTYHFDLVLLALDDISGMDEMSWHIIQRLYRDARNLMIIGTARTELGLNASPKFWEQLTGEDAKLGKFEHMTLPPLEEREVCTNTGRRLSMRTEKSQRRIAQVVYHQSQGNPLLAGEILATLYEDESDGAHPHEVGCLEELLLNRLDSLSPSVRSNLSLCAILGRDFKLSRVVDVIAIYNKLTSDQIFEHAELVAESLKEAVDCGIIYIKNRKAMKYSFSHIFWKETLSNNCLVEWKEDIQSIIAANAGAPAPVSPLGLRSTEVEC